MNLDNNELILQAVQNGIIDLTKVRELVETMNRKKLEELYEEAKRTRKVWKGVGKDTRWKFMKADNSIVAKTKEEDLKKAFIEYHRTKSLAEQRNTMTFAELYSEWLDYKKERVGTNKGQLSPSTYRRYQRDYERYIEDTPFSNKLIITLTSIDIEDFLKSMVIEHELTQSCLKNVSGYIKGCMLYACKRDLLDKNPCAWLDLAPIKGFCAEKAQADKDRILTRKEMQSLLNTLHDTQAKHNAYIQNYAIELATLTGMRVGELAALKWECITDTELKIDYSEHRLDYDDKPCEYIIGEPKNRKHRVFPMSDEMKALFKRIKAIHEKHEIESEYVFANKDGRVNSHTISCAMSRRCKDAGIESRSIHAIRRTVSSYLRTVLPVATVASMLGHLEETNEKYYNYDIMENSEKVECLKSMYQTFQTAKKVA